MKEVADDLYSLVEGAPGGQMLASQLGLTLYSKRPDAKAVVQTYGGLKEFIAIPYLKDLVHLVRYPDLGDKVAVTRRAAVGQRVGAERIDAGE